MWPKKHARSTKRMLSWNSSNRVLLPPKPNVPKNLCAGCDGPNQSRPPSGEPPFSSMRLSMLLTPRSRDCEERFGTLREALASKYFIVGIPCTPMQGSKTTMVCPGGESQGPGQRNVENFIHHYGLPNRGPNLVIGDFLISTLNIEESKL